MSNGKLSELNKKKNTVAIIISRFDKTEETTRVGTQYGGNTIIKYQLGRKINEHNSNIQEFLI